MQVMKNYTMLKYRFGVAGISILASIGCSVFAAAGSAPAAGNSGAGKVLLDEVKASGFRIVWATRGSNQSDNADLYVSNADGSQPVNITGTTDKDERIPRVNWKSGRIAFVAATCASGKLKREGREGLLSFVDPDGKNREETQIDRAAGTDWNPEGTKLVMCWPDRVTGGFRVYDVVAKKVETLVGDKVGILDIDWSHDGKLLVFGSRKELGVRYTLLTISPDGSGMKPFAIGSDDKPYCHPCWHPSSLTVAWNSQQGLLLGDYNAEDGKAKNVRSLVSFQDVGWEDPSPRWSPDGKYILFITSAKRLHVVKVADGTKAELLLPKGAKTEVWDYDWLATTK